MTVDGSRGTNTPKAGARRKSLTLRPQKPRWPRHSHTSQPTSCLAGDRHREETGKRSHSKDLGCSSSLPSLCPAEPCAYTDQPSFHRLHELPRASARPVLARTHGLLYEALEIPRTSHHGWITPIITRFPPAQAHSVDPDGTRFPPTFQDPKLCRKQRPT